MSLVINNIKTYQITEIPDNPNVIFFDCVDMNDNLTRIELHLNTAEIIQDNVVKMEPKAKAKDKINKQSVSKIFKKI